MRTTVDLPSGLHLRARELAAERGESLSATLADLTARGLASLGRPVVLGRSPVTGLPQLSVGRPVTSAEVAASIEEE